MRAALVTVAALLASPGLTARSAALSSYAPPGAPTSRNEARLSYAAAAAPSAPAARSAAVVPTERREAPVPTEQREAVPAAQSGPVFSRDVAPLVFEACTPCHRSGGPGPFSLASYREVRQRATQVVQVTKRRFMPPWNVEPGIGHFEGQRPLSDAELSMIEAWVAAGTPEGDPGDTPALPTFPDGWLLGTPDLIVTPPESFTLPADPNDAFRIFAIPLPVSGRTYVRGIEFRPGRRQRRPSRQHPRRSHADLAAARREDPTPGYDGLLPHSANIPTGTSSAWTPGQAAPLAAEGAGMARSSPGTDLVVRAALQPTGKRERDARRRSVSTSGWTRPSARQRCCGSAVRTSTSRQATRGYVLRDALHAAGATSRCWPCSRTRTTARATCAAPPHSPMARPRRSSRSATGTSAGSRSTATASRCALPKGTRSSMEYIYDNSADEPAQRQSRRRRVLWGQRSTDEMGDFWVQVLTRTEPIANACSARFVQRRSPKTSSATRRAHRRAEPRPRRCTTTWRCCIWEQGPCRRCGTPLPAVGERCGPRLARRRTTTSAPR